MHLFILLFVFFFFFSSRRRHTRCSRDWSSDVCSSDLGPVPSTSCQRSASLASRASRGGRKTHRRSDGSSPGSGRDRKSTRLNSSHGYISYAVFCLKKKKNKHTNTDQRTNRERQRETHC